MKRFIFILLIICIFPFTALADYPVIPETIVSECKIRFDVDDTGSRLLYEKVDIGDGKHAWMLGWFWSDYKIVVGITDESDVIYYNRAALGEPASGYTDSVISHAEGLEIAREFLEKRVSKPDMVLVSSKAYTYNFAYFHHGIRVISHDVTVVVDKATGEVYYYKGFGSTDMEYELMDALLSKNSAYNIYFDKIGFEPVYNCRYSEDGGIKNARPMYIVNNLGNPVVDAQSGEVLDITMTDYNYYYNDSYYDSKYFRDNNIRTDFGFFAKEGAADENVSDYLKNTVYALKKGYHLKAVSGSFIFGRDSSVPAYEIDFVPSDYMTNIDGFISDYNMGIFDNIYDVKTDMEFLYGRAYINAENGKIIKFDAVKNPDCRKPSQSNKAIENRVLSALKLGTEYGDKTQLFSTFYEDSDTLTFCFARYENGIRAIGEGTIIRYDTALNEITYLCENMQISKFPSFDYIKTADAIAAEKKDEIPFGICYVDKDETTKIAVYDILDNNIAFDPVTGNRIDFTSTGDTSTLYVCSIGNTNYSVNGDVYSAPEPVFVNGSLYLPFRFVAENQGYSVGFSNGAVSAVSQTDEIHFVPQSLSYNINGNIHLLPPSLIKDGTTYIPLSTLNTVFGLYSSWDEETNSIFIYN